MTCIHFESGKAESECCTDGSDELGLQMAWIRDLQLLVTNDGDRGRVIMMM